MSTQKQKRIKSSIWLVYSELSEGVMKEMFLEFEDASKYIENHIFEWKMPRESPGDCRNRYSIIEGVLSYKLQK